MVPINNTFLVIESLALWYNYRALQARVCPPLENVLLREPRSFWLVGS